MSLYPRDSPVVIIESLIRDAATREVNIFALIFECVSAYGNVGLSLGNNVVRVREKPLPTETKRD